MTRIRIAKNGSIRFIYDDGLACLQELGISHIKRVSHVEPYNGWQADMSPTGQDIILGPYKTRKEALEAEMQWLIEHNIPTAKENKRG